jgi:hypothetical protein
MRTVRHGSLSSLLEKPRASASPMAIVWPDSPDAVTATTVMAVLSCRGLLIYCITQYKIVDAQGAHRMSPYQTDHLSGRYVSRTSFLQHAQLLVIQVSVIALTFGPVAILVICATFFTLIAFAAAGLGDDIAFRPDAGKPMPIAVLSIAVAAFALVWPPTAQHLSPLGGQVLILCALAATFMPNPLPRWNKAKTSPVADTPPLNA